MTKLEILQKYRATNFFKLLDTWLVYGSNKITIKPKNGNNTSVYNNGILYYLDCPNSPYDKSLIFCIEDYIDPQRNLNWESMTYVDDIEGYISFGNDIISKNFRLLLLPHPVECPVELFDGAGNQIYLEQHVRDFTPFAQELGDVTALQITDEDYREILTSLGAPFLQDLELEYTREEISELAIRPALRHFFKWCPKTRPEVISVTTQVQNVLMPSDAYSVIGLSLQQSGSSAVGDATSPFMYAYEQYMWGGGTSSGITGIYSGFGAPKMNLNGSNSLIYNRAAAQAYTNYVRRVHYEGPYEIKTKEIAKELGGTVGDKYITVYSNVQGSFNIWWGIKSLNFSDVPFNQKDNAIKLATAKVKQLFGNLRRQSKSDLPGQVDYKYLVEEGKTEEKEVIDELKSLVKASGVMRGSLG